MSFVKLESNNQWDSTESVLGLELFNIFINGLNDGIEDCLSNLWITQTWEVRPISRITVGVCSGEFGKLG